ncbi:hypothetical protein [Nonomuraea africana]|uniref:hypothetical protein n=1 Tax=Nonomuraea africana TaxID=46171 RepID=UPI0033C930A4
MSLRIHRWILFEVFFALMPIIFNYANSRMIGVPASYATLVGKGELLLISGAICAAGMGELVASITKKSATPQSGSRFAGLKITLIATSAILIAGTSWFYASTAERIQLTTNAGKSLHEAAINFDSVAATSTAILLFAMLTSIGCLIVAEVS